MVENAKRKKILVMISGGRDSFLAACKMVEKGYHVRLITYDNGSMSGVNNVNELAERMQKRFGEEFVSVAGIHQIAQNISPLLNRVLYEEPIKLCAEYPHLVYNQLTCLACHSAMYLHSIAYCKANNLDGIAEGARKQQKFFVELPEMLERYTELCTEHGIELYTPMFDFVSDIERKREIANWGLLPKSYEPQCWLGCPLLNDLSNEQREDLAKYYDNEMKPLFDNVISSLVGIKTFDVKGSDYI